MSDKEEPTLFGAAMTPSTKDPNAVALGRKGGQAKSDAKTKAARENAKKRWAKR